MYLLGLKYLEALPKITEGAGTTIFLPSEATGVMGAIGGLRELLGGGSGRAGGAAARPAPPRAAAPPARGSAPGGAYPAPRAQIGQGVVELPPDFPGGSGGSER